MTSELKPINKSGYGSPISYDRQEAMRILSLCVCKSCSGTGERNDADCGDIFYSTWECTDCDGKGWDKQIYMESFPCTRAVPDVPALVRYGWKDHGMVKVFDGEYVSHDQAVEVIADERNKNEQLLKRAQTSEIRHKDTTAAFERERKQSLQQQQEIKELDAKLAQINDQKIVNHGWIVRERRDSSGNLMDCFVEAPMAEGMAYGLEVLGDDYTGYGDTEGKLEHCKQIVSWANAAPVVSETVTIERRYRLLGTSDTIEGTDEFIEDDAVTWSPIKEHSRWSIGMKYNRSLKEMRRPLSCALSGKEPS